MSKFVLMVILWGASTLQALAGSVDVRHAEFTHQTDTWVASTTLRHGDTGWKHYADAWRIVTETGQLLATRVLYHPHVNEQPFTRSLSNVKLPEGMQRVLVEAHCNVHGWSKERLSVDLNLSKGPRFEVNR